MRYPRLTDSHDMEDFDRRVDAYESIDWYEQAKENARIREEEEEGITPVDGNYSLDDLPY